MLPSVVLLLDVCSIIHCLRRVDQRVVPHFPLVRAGAADLDTSEHPQTPGCFHWQRFPDVFPLLLLLPVRHLPGPS
jgi:hypothetical protein